MREHPSRRGVHTVYPRITILSRDIPEYEPISQDSPATCHSRARWKPLEVVGASPVHPSATHGAKAGSWASLRGPWLQRARALEHTAHIRAGREGRRTRRLRLQGRQLSPLGWTARRGEVGRPKAQGRGTTCGSGNAGQRRRVRSRWRPDWSPRVPGVHRRDP